MEFRFRRVILGQFLFISLALTMGLMYKDYFNGNHKSHDVAGFINRCKNASLFAKREEDDHDDDVGKRACLETKPSSSSNASREVIDVDHGDPTMYERFWQEMGDKTTVVIPGWKFISYFSDLGRICWFLEQEFENAVIRLHNLVRNAVTDDHYIVVGTGSSQLYQAALYAVSPLNATEPIDVVSAAPFYSSYPLITDILKSGLYTWGGDAREFNKDEPYIELVTSPNNPDGFSREAVVNNINHNGILIHDLAYYWPQYTAITSRADHDIMLFTVSKSTGHAGSRLGWALVKDPEIAKKMTEFIVVSTIGVSKESQLRAAKILEVISESHEHKGDFKESNAFFHHSYNMMTRRWRQLRDAVKKSDLFSLPDFPSNKCAFSGKTFSSQPAFAWLKCKGGIKDCESFLRGHKILTRSGRHFGDSEEYVRISILPRDEVFERFIERLASINSSVLS